jgi:hypothetical protein
MRPTICWAIKRELFQKTSFRCHVGQFLDSKGGGGGRFLRGDSRRLIAPCPFGSNEGAWVPPEGSPRETIHPDTTPHDIGDHVDWLDIYNNKWKWVEETGKWHPAEGNKDNRPQPIFPEGTLVPPKGSPNQIPGNEPGGTTAPTQPIPFFPFWPWPATPAVPKPVPTPSPFPVPAFGLPVLIIPIWPKPDTLRDYSGPPLA